MRTICIMNLCLFGFDQHLILIAFQRFFIKKRLHEPMVNVSSFYRQFYSYLFSTYSKIKEIYNLQNVKCTILATYFLTWTFHFTILTLLLVCRYTHDIELHHAWPSPWPRVTNPAWVYKGPQQPWLTKGGSMYRF